MRYDEPENVTSTLTLPPEPEPLEPATSTEVVGTVDADEAATRDPRWARPALFLLLAATAFLYLWDLSASGYANSFYSAAVQAGTHSWQAFFFGSFDSSNFITVDKPPASLWVMELSARIFGVNSWSLLVPEALMGVATVGVLYATVKRWFGAGAGLIAGAILALTPVAVLMFRFNNPDALLVLLLTLAAYAITRGIEDGRTRWIMLASVLIGTGFITKMMQAFVVVPGFALVYLIAAPGSTRRRIGQLLAGGVALLAASFWWVVAVMAVPASSRPYIGGSQNNSLWNLIFGYNGFGRLTGNESGSVGGGGGNAGPNWGPTGWNRMFNTEFGGQISWLVPAALILAAGGLWLTWSRPRTDRLRAGLLLWGAWLLVTGLTFSFASGIIHPYYTVALAPAVGGLVGIGGVGLWRARSELLPRIFLAVAVIVAAWWSYDLLNRSPNWLPGLRIMVLLAGVAAAAGLLFADSLRREMALGVVALAIAAGGAGPLAYSLNTVRTAHDGALPTAGPAVQGASFGPGRGGARPGAAGARGGLGTFPGGPPAGVTPGQGGRFTGPQGGQGQLPGGTGTAPSFGGQFGGQAGGLLNASRPSAELVAALKANAGSYTWVLAITGANSAAGYQLASDEPVMAIGGFNGTDPTPTLAQFQEYVQAGKIHYYIASGGGFGGARGGAAGGKTSSASSEIAAWVAANYTSTTIGGTTVYDLSSNGARRA